MKKVLCGFAFGLVLMVAGAQAWAQSPGPIPPPNPKQSPGPIPPPNPKAMANPSNRIVTE